jgi:predicted enzyme related to lactoylglutathione lyase
MSLTERNKSMNPVVHFELPYDNRDRIAKFYEAVFGWRLEKLGPEMGNYVIATTATTDAKSGAPAGAINGGFYERKADWPGQHPSVVIGVSKIEDSMTQVTKAGGKVLGEPMDIPGVGRYVAFFDTEGNRLSMLQPLPAMR